MPNMLHEIIASKKLEIQHKKASLAFEQLKQMVAPGNGSFLRAVQKPVLNIIAEIKPKSPSAGTLSNNFRLDKIISGYNRYACAISVLTDQKYFGGSMESLSEITQLSGLPILCKDFILDIYQCYLARYHGAQAALLIVKILSQEQLEQLYAHINKLGMTTVLEVQNEVELKRAIELQPEPEVILINNRNLEDFKINFATTKTLAPIIQSATNRTTIISASGLQSKSDIEALLPFCSNFLIGSQLMRSNNLEKDFKELLSAKSTMPEALHATSLQRKQE